MKNHSRSLPEAKAAFQQSASESELVRRAKAGDMEAFEALVSQFERRVYTLALRITSNEHDAQDVTQETFLSALENLNKFREEASFTTWLSRIATHAALKIIRKRKGLPSVSLDAERGEGSDEPPLPLPDFIADWNQSPLELAQRHETRRVLDAALASLDEKHRAVFVLRDIEGLSVKETAETLGLSEANVKVRLLRARLQLRERLTRVFGDPTRRVLRQAHHHS